MPRFEPFRGLRYDPALVDLGDVIAPPYDVIDDRERARLAARSPHNAVHVDLPMDEGGEGRYRLACRRLSEWRDKGVLRRDPEPALYVYRMVDGDRRTTGVLGALELSRPEEGGILPHEETTPKARTDRLQLLRSCRANLSAIWALSPAPGLTSLLEVGDRPAASATDEAGVVHQLWVVSDRSRVDAVAAAVASRPAVIADGHHRYETSLAFRDEQPGPGPWDAVLAYVVELVDHELDVRAIHRVLSGLPADLDLPAALAPWFRAAPAARRELTPPALAAAGALGLVTRPGAWWLHPRPDALAGARDLDSSRLDVARRGLPPHEVAYQHDPVAAVTAVDRGDAEAAVLLRPATVAQIAATAEGGQRMPPKTTYFAPKPRTGLVFRLLEP